MKTSTLSGFSFIIPALILISIFVVYPIIATIALSFNVSLGLGGGVVRDSQPGLENYYVVLASPSFINVHGIETLSFPMGAIVHNILWIAIHLPLTIMLGLLFAVLLQNVKGGAVIRSFMFLGMVIPMIVGGLLIMFSLDRDLGVVNLFLKVIGLGSYARSWTIYPDTALFSLILGSLWLWSGFSVTLYSAGLSSLPRELIEAAVVDGASFRRILFDIIIPQLKPVTVTVVAMTILWDLKIFDIVYASTMGGPGGASMVLAVLMYDYFARALNYPMASTVATILTLVTIPPAILLFKYSKTGEAK
ncbi:MAG: sugar ABC transporter permease [Desulfurococcus sp.]|nr:sugar ABC transporter permease [Desulfurococcus sp.]